MNETISGTLYLGSGVTPDIRLSETSGITTAFNINQQDVDFSILGTTNGLIYFDASTGRLGVGTGVPDAVLHVVAPCAKDGLIIESVTNCATGVTLLLVHNPQTQPVSGSYPAILNLAGRDTNYNEIIYGQIMSRIVDPITGYTSGELIFTVDQQGTNKPVLVANLNNISLGGNNSVSGYKYTVMGGNNSISGNSLTIVGAYNSGLSNTGTVVGNINYVNGNNILSLTNSSYLVGDDNVIVGQMISVDGASNLLIGDNIVASGTNNILLGNDNVYDSSFAVGLSQSSMSSGLSGIVLGSYTYNTGNNNIYIGNLNSVLGDNNSMVGSQIALEGNNNVVYGSSDNIINGEELICVGSNQNISNLTSGIFLGNNISLSDSYKSIIVGLGNNINQGLQQSILLGINNNVASGSPSGLLLIGQSNFTKDIDGSVIVGNTNNLSGTVTNNLVIGSLNAAPSVSNNNLILGILNNQTGIYIDSVGTITGVAGRTTGPINNSIIVGINNVAKYGNTNILIGNKNTASGWNLNAIGSYNVMKNTSGTYAVGNSNFMIGNQLGIVGSKISAVGAESIAFNTANKKMDMFGSGNIVIGYNQMVSSGIVIGTSNKTDGVNNIVYGRDNTIGSTRNPCFIDDVSGYSLLIPTANILDQYVEGDKVLICIQNPPSVLNTFIREITDVVENYIDNTTILTFTIPISIDSSNGYYSINNSFDDDNVPSTRTSGLIMPYQEMGGHGGTEIDSFFGSDNIVIGSKNRYLYSSGITIGYNNNISGVRNITIGYSITGVADNTVYLGTNNTNKMILDDSKVVFNSGAFQDNFIIKSSNDDTSIININLNNNRVGINTDDPTSALSVSGRLTTDSFKLGFSAQDQYVLTTNVNGIGTWDLPVRLSGDNGGLLYKVTDKGASGISEILYDPTTKSMNFNLGGDNGFYINSSGLFVNDEAASYGVRIRGSGGVDFSKTLFNTNFANHRIDFYNVDGNSGLFNNFNVISGMKLPTNLTGTFLYVNNVGNLNSYVSRPHSIIFSNESSLSSGNTSIRWINPQQTLALGATGVVQYDLLSTNSTDSFYNILLSSNSSIDTVFNNRGLGNKFSVINSGALNSRIGFHINPSGSISINTAATDLATYNSEAILYANGKAWLKSLKVGEGSAPSGLYLRTDQYGNIRFSNIDLNTQFSGVFPLSVANTYQGVDGSFRVDVSLSSKKLTGENLGVDDDGTLIAWRGDAWVNTSGIRLYQSPRTINAMSTIRGIEFGYKSQTTNTNHNHVFAGGSFKVTEPAYNGSSQKAVYYLRTRTTYGADVRPLVTNWTKNATVSTETRENCINLTFFDTNTNYDYDRVWLYNIEASVLWQVGTSNAPSAQGTRSAGTYVIEGGLFRNASGTRFDKLGTENVRYYGDTMPGGMGLSTVINTDGSIPRLTLLATGTAAYTALWSATVNVNQLNHPGADALYSS